MRLYLSRIEGPPPKRNAPGSNPGKRATSEQAMYACSDFFVKIGAHSRRCSSSFAKSHARLACSLVNALTTAPGRYQLFASLPPATSIQAGLPPGKGLVPFRALDLLLSKTGARVYYGDRFYKGKTAGLLLKGAGQVCYNRGKETAAFSVLPDTGARQKVFTGGL